MHAVILWFFVHIFISLSLILGRKIYIYMSPIFTVILILVYILKPETYDLPYYLNYFKSPHPYHEPLFYYLSFILSNVMNGKLTLTIISIFVLILILFSLKFLRKGLYWLFTVSSVPLILSSIYFLLGSQNAIRQFISAVFLVFLFSILVSMKNKSEYKHGILVNFLRSILALFLGLISVGFHLSGLLFLPIILVLSYFSRYKIRMIFRINSLLVMIVGAMFSLTLYSFMSDSIYFSKEVDWGEERFGNFPKLILFNLYTSFGYLYIRKSFHKIFYNMNSDAVLTYVNNFRFYYMLFITPFAFISGEMYPRLLFFFYAIDILWILLIYTKSQLRLSHRIIISISIMMYGFLPNGINILTKT